MTSHPWIKFYRDGRFESELTFAQAEDAISSRSRALKRAGVRSRDRVIVQMPNSIEVVLTYLALARLSAIAVPVSPHESDIRIRHIINDCSPRFIACGDGSIASTGLLSAPFETGGDVASVATIIYTSGTTGRPKGVCLSVQNWDDNASALIAHHHLDEDSVLATPLPLFHCNAHGLGMRSSYMARATLVLFDRTPPNFLRIVQHERVSIVSVVPAILHNLVQQNPSWRPYPALRYFLTAAAPLPADLLRSVLSRWNTRVIQGYGLTESTNFSCTLPVDLSDSMYEQIMFPHPSVGVALAGVDVTIAGTSNQGEVGEVLIRSNANCLGYWGSALIGREVVETGDIGHFRVHNGRRFYYLEGRTKELINRGGENLYPLELEAELRAAGVPGEFHVFAVPDVRMGEEVAIAVLKPCDPSLFQTVPLFRRPKRMYELISFPVTSTGKVQRLRLTQIVLADASNEWKMVWEHGQT